MSKYRGDFSAIRALMRDAEVHRDVYIDEEVFQLEMEHVFANAWVYVGHDSQIPNPGDFYATTIGMQPVVMVRAQRRRRACRPQPLSAQGHQDRRRDLRQCRQIFPLPLSRLECSGTDGSLLGMPLRAATKTPASSGPPAAQGLTPGRRVAQLSRLRVRPAVRREARGSRSSSARACRASTTWSTARRPDGSKSPAACCATCTIATGRCWSRTRPTPAIPWWRTSPRPARRSKSGRRRRRHAEADGGRNLRAVHEPLRILREDGHPHLGQRPRAYRRQQRRSTPTIPPFPAISRRWSRPTARRAPKRSSTRTGTTPSTSPT